MEHKEEKEISKCCKAEVYDACDDETCKCTNYKCSNCRKWLKPWEVIPQPPESIKYPLNSKMPHDILEAGAIRVKKNHSISDFVANTFSESKCLHKTIESNMCESYCRDCRMKFPESKPERKCDGCKLFSTMGVHSFTCPIRQQPIHITFSESLEEKVECENPLREEFAEYLRDNWEDRETLPVADWWLDKMAKEKEEILAYKGQRSREDYMRGAEEMRQKIIDEVKKLNLIEFVPMADPMYHRGFVDCAKEILNFLKEKNT